MDATGATLRCTGGTPDCPRALFSRAFFPRFFPGRHIVLNVHSAPVYIRHETKGDSLAYFYTILNF
jgi:hypothetical protein